MSVTKKLLILLFMFLLSSCGGGGGGGSSSSASGSSTTLASSVGSLSNYQVTAGNTLSLNGSTTLSFNSIFRIILAKFNDGIISSARASVSSCSSSGLVATSDNQNWSLIGLSSSTSTPACVSQIQDAGNYLVLAVSGVTDSSGNACDLAVIAKSTGNTTCITVPLANRATSGAPIFFLDPSNAQTPGQLTLNGNYFFVGFYTASNVSSAYEGFLRLDFTGAVPTASIAYLSYGSADPQNSQRINGESIFWAPYYPMENGDLMFTQFNLTGSASAVPQIGIVQTYYVVVNPSLSDPTTAVKALVNQTTTTSSDGYSIDLTNSPIAPIVTPLAGDITQIHYNNDAYPDPSASATVHSFYINVGTNSSTYQPACVNQNGANTSTLLLKGVVSTNGTLTFTNYGGSNLGNGLGANSLSNDVTPDGNGNLVTLLWKATSPTSFTVTKYIRPLAQNPTCSASIIYTGSGSGFTANNNISIWTIRTANNVFMQNFNYNSAGGGSCQNGLGCPIGSSVALAYNIATGAVSAVPLTPLNGSQYYVNGEYSTSTSDRLYVTLSNNSVSPATSVTAQLTTTGFTKIIQFKPATTVTHPVVKGTGSGV